MSSGGAIHLPISKWPSQESTDFKAVSRPCLAACLQHRNSSKPTGSTYLHETGNPECAGLNRRSPVCPPLVQKSTLLTKGSRVSSTSTPPTWAIAYATVLVVEIQRHLCVLHQFVLPIRVGQGLARTGIHPLRASSRGFLDQCLTEATIDPRHHDCCVCESPFFPSGAGRRNDAP